MTVVVTVVVGVQGIQNEDDSRLVCRLENVVWRFCAGGGGVVGCGRGSCTTIESAFVLLVMTQVLRVY